MNNIRLLEIIKKDDEKKALSIECFFCVFMIYIRKCAIIQRILFIGELTSDITDTN